MSTRFALAGLQGRWSVIREEIVEGKVVETVVLGLFEDVNEARALLWRADPSRKITLDDIIRWATKEVNDAKSKQLKEGQLDSRACLSGRIGALNDILVKLEGLQFLQQPE